MLPVIATELMLTVLQTDAIRENKTPDRQTAVIGQKSQQHVCERDKERSYPTSGHSVNDGASRWSKCRYRLTNKTLQAAELRQSWNQHTQRQRHPSPPA